MLSSSAVVVALFCAVQVTQACDPTPQVCPQNKTREKICVKFEMHFDNRCVMKSELCRLAKLGFHYVGERKVFDSCCNAGIPDFYSPVCGSDGKTYDNEWEMDYFACEGKNYVTKVDIKNCPDWVDPNSLYPPEFWASWGKN